MALENPGRVVIVIQMRDHRVEMIKQVQWEDADFYYYSHVGFNQKIAKDDPQLVGYYNLGALENVIGMVLDLQDWIIQEDMSQQLVTEHDKILHALLLFEGMD